MRALVPEQGQHAARPQLALCDRIVIDLLRDGTTLGRGSTRIDPSCCRV